MKAGSIRSMVPTVVRANTSRAFRLRAMTQARSSEKPVDKRPQPAKMPPWLESAIKGSKNFPPGPGFCPSWLEGKKFFLAGDTGFRMVADSLSDSDFQTVFYPAFSCLPTLRNITLVERTAQVKSEIEGYLNRVELALAKVRGNRKRQKGEAILREMLFDPLVVKRDENHSLPRNMRTLSLYSPAETRAVVARIAKLFDLHGHANLGEWIKAALLYRFRK